MTGDGRRPEPAGVRQDFDAEAVLQTFFGCKPGDVPADFVCTPIPAFYSALVSRASDVVEYRGWWRMATVTLDRHRYGVVQHFEGSRVVDVLYALAGPGSRAAFLGLVGGLDDSVEIGDVVGIDVALRHGEPAERAIGSLPAGAVTALTVDGMLEAAPVGPASPGRAQVVDLETHFFYRAARGTAVAASAAWALVTDKPAVRPFWQVPLTDEDLDDAASRMFPVLNEWLDLSVDRSQGEM
ncbi:hypothetical protein V1634_05925 [Plantactinospora veratri]|uniref:Uncharacterized protein n=1 Tax=Plantactinospora veratri TaxID=1436122 RepID=A0ABU7S8V1_9ACTN